MIPYNPLSLPNAFNGEEEAPTARQAAPKFEKPYFTTLYFGYASNLSYQTMKQRCPDSLFAGMARLQDYKIFINSTRYCNIKPSPGDVVYGSLCFLSNRDELALDQSEGVPIEYQKERLKVTRVNEDGTDMEDSEVEALVYVDGNRTSEEAQIEPDYVVWINKAIKDGIKFGMPAEYAEKYIRPFTPLPTGTDEIIMIRTTKNFSALTMKAPIAPARD